jgi:ferredoxin
MSTNAYRRLAQRLDAVPNGFPATESGVELRILAKLFTPQEANLAAEMRLGYEPADQIAARAGTDPEDSYQTLKGMARRGLIRARRGDSGLEFALMPFVVGFYEEQLPRIDPELATLVDQYFHETRGRTILDTPPAIHRVIPVEEAIPFDLEIFPHERAAAIVESARSWGVRDCICRVQQRLLGKGCDRPVTNCLVLAPVEGAFQAGGVTHPITKERALEILEEAEEAGLVHSTSNFRDRIYYICNCCTCCCAVLRGVAEFGVPGAVARSGFRAHVEAEACTGCGACEERCLFGALSIIEGSVDVNVARCVGCGLCAVACPSGAIELERLPADEVTPLPTDIREWTVRRARARGQSLDQIT